jgi:hypothetical protein
MYGRSMLLSLLDTSLRDCPGIQVFYGCSWEEVNSQGAGHVPDVVIYDLFEPPERVVLDLLHQNPHLLLIGLDVETNRAFMISGRETKSLTLEKVRDIVETSEI